MQLKRIQKSTRRGDTIIETMFAFAIFGMIAIINIQIMQQGMRINQTALEVNLAREQITAQAESLRLASLAYASEFSIYGGSVKDNDNLLWNKIIKNNLSSNLKPLHNYVKDGFCQQPPAKAFAIDSLNGDINDSLKKTFALAKVYPRLVYRNAADENKVNIDARDFDSAEGIWIEAIAGNDNLANPSFYDFMIRTCWHSSASPTPLTLESLVRLYVPTK